MTDRPEPFEYASYSSGYVGAVPPGDILELFESGIGRTMRLPGTQTVWGLPFALFRILSPGTRSITSA